MKFIDLFAGIGGMRIGFEKAGGKCVFASEIDVFCQKTYTANFEKRPLGDITKVDSSQIPDHDVLVAGFPCQPFSLIGKKKGIEDQNGKLFNEILRILEFKKTKVFLLENVVGLKTVNNGDTFLYIISSLNKLGYKVFYQTLDAKDFNLPQKRKRLFLVGFDSKVFGKDLEFEFPKGFKKKKYINQILENDIKGYEISKQLQQNYLFKKGLRQVEVVNKQSKIQVRALLANYYRVQRLTGSFVEDGETGLRFFTSKECLQIMGFPKKFKLPVSRTQIYKQLGNAVCVPVVKELAVKIIEILENHKKINIYDDYNYELNVSNL